MGAGEVENMQLGPTTNRGGSPGNSGNSDTESGSQSIMRRTRPGTKLPLPRDVSTKGREQLKDKQPTPPKHREYGSLGNVRPRKSSTTLYSSPDETIDKDREQYWQKVRDKFERPSPSGKIRDNYKEPYIGAYRKIMSLANSPKSEALKQKLKYAGGATRDLSKTRIASPIIHPRLRPGYSSPDRSDNDSTAQLNKYIDEIQRTNSGTDESLLHLSPDKTDNATDSSLNSRTSSSPVSGPSSSLTEWEDRFVVNMPSAKEPNPPTMSAQQITEFQHSIEKVHTEGGAMLDPDSLPSPRTTTPDDKNTSPEHPDKPTTFDGQDPPPPTKTRGDEDSPSTQRSHPRYYCPDEIGRSRISTIWEESPATKPRKDTPSINPDGSFLGCKEINGSKDKNPDEILLFAPTERPRVVDVSSPMLTSPKDRTKFTVQQRRADKEEKTTAQEGWKPASPNLKLAQCSKPLPSTMCRDTSCHQVDKLAQASSQEKPDTHRPNKPFGEKKVTCRDDDVFIITPIITRTMVSMNDIRGHAQKTSSVPTPTSRTAGEIITDARARPQIKPSPLGLRRATQNSQEKSNASSAAPSRSVPVRTIAVVKNRAEAGRRKVEPSRDMRGYIRMPSMGQPSSEDYAEHAGNKSHQARASSTGSRIESHRHVRTISDSTHLASSSVPNISPIGSIDRGQQGCTSVAQNVAKVVEVAELDGLQVQEPKEQAPQPRITDLSSDLPEMVIANPTKSATNALTLALIMEILIISAAQMEALWQRVMSNRHSKTALLKLALNGVLEMLEHCLQVLRTWLTAFSTYNVTGVWPRPADQDLAQSVADVCRAAAYLVILCFMMTVVERAAEYIVLVGS
ncbi:putative NTP binding protein [Aspergillus clavatus NRRL 1]|uniref:NTP binding protein, putative n=1 Tax=Aspergillus clavatus (strain ATCC 1007 / CBS 513.65 / DSM 816 / NCTC 3887 / NRRL 1 / QM 1276 / 107) TaxID=344612 RepID=A1C6H4_ASPCL|nr:NTP binding protein, putative [Aspergillus clavatus NRRL 1]EAW13995.1 NTP binding protein, putative [Aspergillus clavatus NRRL 1]